MVYFNTTHSAGRELRELREKADGQEKLIAEFFSKRRRQAFTPSQVQAALQLDAVPLTSIRRAICRLTDRELLEKTSRQQRGPYGRPEHLWRWRRAELQLGLFAEAGPAPDVRA